MHTDEFETSFSLTSLPSEYYGSALGTKDRQGFVRDGASAVFHIFRKPCYVSTQSVCNATLIQLVDVC